ncbi:recombination protein F [compost metagenome]
MRLEKLQVSGFGHLHGLSIDLDGPVTVLYGPNEAGKSTLLGFVRAMLFGIPSRTYGAQRYEPVKGTVHGGMLTIRADDGARWVIERYAQPPEGAALSGTRGDRLRITVNDVEGNFREVTQEEMQKVLLAGMSKDMFKQLFAISLTELQEVAALQSEEMNTFLFHAGIGGGNAILRGEKKLISEMDKLYRPKGRNQEVAQILQSIERLNLEAKTVKSLLPRYHELLEELSQVSDALSRSEEELAVRSQEASRLHRAATSRADWIKREAAMAELGSLSSDSSTYPQQGIARWNAVQDDKERLLLENSELARVKDLLQQDLDSIHLDEMLLNHDTSLRSLAERLPGYESRLRELGDIQAEIKSLSIRIKQGLQSIHPDWTETHLRSFAGTVGERELVRQFISRFGAYDKEMEMLRNERFKLEREVLSLEAAYANAAQIVEESEVQYRKQFSIIAPEDRSEIRILWNEIRAELDRWRELANSREAERRAAEAEQAAGVRMKSLYKKMLGGAGLLTLVLPVILWLTTKQMISSAISGIALLGLDIILWSGIRSNDKSFHRSKRRRGMQTGENSTATDNSLKTLVPKLIRHPLTAAAGAASITRTASLELGSGNSNGTAFSSMENWEEEERLLRRLMENWQLWAQRQEVLETECAASRRRTAEKIDELQAQEREMARREEAFSKLSEEWEQWLMDRNLPSLLTPEAALDVFHIAEQGREWLGRFDDLSDKELALKADNEAFVREAKAYGIHVGDDSTGGVGYAGSAEIIFAVRQAFGKLDRQLEMKARYEIISAKMKSLEEEQGRLNDRMNRVMVEESHLLQASGAHDGEEFLRKGAEAARCEELEREIRQWDLLLFGTLDNEKSADLESLLRSSDEEELVEWAEQAERVKRETESQRLELQERRGRILQEMETLEARGRQGDLLQQLAEQKSLLGNALDKYAVMAVCHELIVRVRQIYEEERQPAVLLAASNYLQRMTGGVYFRILMKMGSQELLAEHREHGPIGSSYLSRGTAEQLYLSMRLALSDAVSGQLKLPILLDDLFVNFDHSRMTGALSVIQTVSEQHQVIMMTCHDHIAQGVMNKLPDCQIIHL